jgi:hypothetical protein
MSRYYDKNWLKIFFAVDNRCDKDEVNIMIMNTLRYVKMLL